MDNRIYQNILDSIRSLTNSEWDKIVFYAQYDRDSYEMKYYSGRNGEYKDCFSLGIPDKTIIDVFIALNETIEKFREEFLRENKDIWSVMTVVFDKNEKVNAYYDYTDISENTLSYKSEWKKRYLN